jgi:drug/metabolite transporter (DMT)-like permease
MDRPTATGPPASGQTFWTLMVMLCAIGFGLVPMFARGLTEAGMAAPAIAFFRYALTAMVTLPFLALSPEKRGLTMIGTAAGFCMGIGWIAYVEAVKVAPVSTVGVVYMTYPLFTLLATWALLNQRPQGRAMIAGLLIVAGAGMALSPQALAEAPISALLLAFAAPLSFGVSITILTGWLYRLSPLERIATVPLGACIGLLPLMLSADAAHVLPQPDDWPLIVGIAVTTALLPMLLYVIAAPRIGAARAAIAGSFELPTMFAVGWLAFGESVGPLQFFAGALVVGAIFLVPRRTYN